MPVDSKVWNQSWLEHNSQRRYPLFDGVSATSLDGAFKIPDDFLLDMSIPYPTESIVDPADFRVQSISSGSGGYVVTLSHGEQPIGVFTVSESTHVYGRTYPVFGIVQGVSVSAGSVTIGNLSNIDQQPAGLWLFDNAGARLQPRCVIPSIGGVVGIQIKQGSNLSDILQDTVILESGSNSRIRVDTDTNTIYIDAIGDDQFLEECVCEGGRQQGEPIRTINGVAPNANGDFVLQPGRGCISIDSITHGLLFADTCAEPCCGCEELDIIFQAMQTLQAQFANISGFADRLEASSAQIKTVVLASPLYSKIKEYIEVS